MLKRLQNSVLVRTGDRNGESKGGNMQFIALRIAGNVAHVVEIDNIGFVATENMLVILDTRFGRF